MTVATDTVPLRKLVSTSVPTIKPKSNVSGTLICKYFCGRLYMNIISFLLLLFIFLYLYGYNVTVRGIECQLHRSSYYVVAKLFFISGNQWDYFTIYKIISRFFINYRKKLKVNLSFNLNIFKFCSCANIPLVV